MSECFKWSPWDDFYQELEELPIKEPPCKYCKHFKPRRSYDDEGNYIGVVICHGESMELDFSCFVSKGANGND